MTTSTPGSQQDVKLAIVLVTVHEHLRFETSVPALTTVLGLKELLYKTLAGRPHPSGQSLMHLGRTLENSEVLGQFLNVGGVTASRLTRSNRRIGTEDRCPHTLHHITSSFMDRKTSSGDPSDPGDRKSCSSTPSSPAHDTWRHEDQSRP
jgi:hypothetical protein